MHQLLRKEVWRDVYGAAAGWQRVRRQTQPATAATAASAGAPVLPLPTIMSMCPKSGGCLWTVTWSSRAGLSNGVFALAAVLPGDISRDKDFALSTMWQRGLVSEVKGSLITCMEWKLNKAANNGWSA